MKLQSRIFYTFVLFLFVSICFTNAGKRNCPKLTESACKAARGECRWVSGQTCAGKFQRFCVTDGGKCKAKETCAKTENKEFYTYRYSCLPGGFKSTKLGNCNCSILPPAAPSGAPRPPGAPPGETFCAQLPYEACVENKDQCDSRYGTACGNLQYTFCRGLRVCNSTDRCAREPASGLNYLFLEFCIPSGWIPLPLNNCKCAPTTTNQCPQCPPGYSCDPDGPLDPSNCISIGTVPILPPSEPPEAFY